MISLRTEEKDAKETLIFKTEAAGNRVLYIQYFRFTSTGFDASQVPTAAQPNDSTFPTIISSIKQKG